MSQIKFLAYLASKDLTPSEYAYAYCYVNQVAIFKDLKVDPNLLHKKNILIKNGEGWLPTKKAKTIVKQSELFFLNDETTTKTFDSNKLGELAEYLQYVFPKDNGEGRLLRSNKKDIMQTLRKFFIKYDHDMNTVARATDEYVREHIENQKTQILMNITYFILKSNRSTLATYCDEITNPDNEI